MNGFVGDGILMRCSMLGESAVVFPVLERFVLGLMKAVPERYRKAFVGSQLAQAMACDYRRWWPARRPPRAINSVSGGEHHRLGIDGRA